MELLSNLTVITAMLVKIQFLMQSKHIPLLVSVNSLSQNPSTLFMNGLFCFYISTFYHNTICYFHCAMALASISDKLSPSFKRNLVLLVSS